MSGAGPGYGERIAWLRLARTRGIGPVGFARLLAHYGTAADALDDLPARYARAGRPPPSPPGRDSIETELEQLAAGDVACLTGLDPAYPAWLAAIPDPPPVLLARGDLKLLDRPCCAMVGARNASAAGMRLARELAHGLGQEDVSVVSGLARGVDGAAHAGALETGTVAVLAGSLDYIYPPEHAELHAAIGETGLLVSEMPLGSIPTARDFPRRNRLISGLSLATLVIEAAMRSGSLITARLAGEQGREVMAVPGSPLDPRARGSNRLLRDGAHLVETVDDILAILAAAPRQPAQRPRRPGLTEDGLGFEPEGDPPAEPLPVKDPDLAIIDRAAAVDRVADLLSPTPVSPDELARQAGLPSGLVTAALLEMEMEGRLARLPGGLVQRLEPVH
ncbi:DNA-processing protein DprA [Maricaulis sp. CAU 1757]